MKELLQKFASRHDVIVLGGGISGITTAIVLQSLGYKPVIVTDYLSHGMGARSFVPSDFAMASAYPHELRVQNFEQITDHSQAAFAHLESIPWSGVATYQMFEVFEHEPVLPHSLSRRMNLRLFDGAPSSLIGTIDPPARKDAAHVWGWRFETFFIDIPIYMKVLWTLFAERGGVVEYTRVDEMPITDIPVVNCLGIGAIKTVHDQTSNNIMRGVQIMMPAAPSVTNQQGMPICYNYTPSAEVYSRADGNPEYVHFFPRVDGWVLGQTREPGQLDADGNWVGERVPTTKPIIDLNAELLRSWKGLTMDCFQIKLREGYRYYRDPDKSGVRLEAEESGTSLTIHNYGHGGSGVTVSWGCAMQCAQMLMDKTRSPGVVPIRSAQERLPWIFGH